MVKQKKEKKKIETEGITVAGKRKTAIAKATIKKGSGIIRINRKNVSLLNPIHRLMLLEPIKIASNILKGMNFDININVKGSGVESQIEASRLAIARALVNFTKNQQLRKAFLDYDKTLLVADTRRKETYKPCDSKARAKRQKSKR